MSSDQTGNAAVSTKLGWLYLSHYKCRRFSTVLKINMSYLQDYMKIEKLIVMMKIHDVSLLYFAFMLLK